MSDFLFAQPSFLSGVGRIVDLAGVLDAYNSSETEAEADTRAARSDWLATGRDIVAAVDAQ